MRRDKSHIIHRESNVFFDLSIRRATVIATDGVDGTTKQLSSRSFPLLSPLHTKSASSSSLSSSPRELERGSSSSRNSSRRSSADLAENLEALVVTKTDGENGLRVVKVLEAAQTSLKNQGAFVPIE